MKVTIDTKKKQLVSTSNQRELFLIIIEGRPQKQYFDARRYFEILPKVYTGPRPKRSFQVGQVVQLEYDRYPTLFKIHEILKGATGDEVLVLTFNWDGVDNQEDINR